MARIIEKKDREHRTSAFLKLYFQNIVCLIQAKCFCVEILTEMDFSKTLVMRGSIFKSNHVG